MTDDFQLLREYVERNADELIIVRHDRTVTPQGESDVTSELRLRKTGGVKL